MSWAEIKKAVNSDIDNPLDIQIISAIGLLSYENQGTDSIILADAYYLDKLFQKPLFVNALDGDELYIFLNFADSAGLVGELLDLKYGIQTDATTLNELAADTGAVIEFLGQFSTQSKLTALHSSTKIMNKISNYNSDVVTDYYASGSSSTKTISKTLPANIYVVEISAYAAYTVPPNMSTTVRLYIPTSGVIASNYHTYSSVSYSQGAQLTIYTNTSNPSATWSIYPPTSESTNATLYTQSSTTLTDHGLPSTGSNMYIKYLPIPS